jgi:SWI/SNF-related matrix-associated actin-dependent regulator of chromatin subfamily A-like protein 1
MKILSIPPPHPNAEPLFGVSHYPFSKKLQATAFEIPGVTWSSEYRAYVGYRDGVSTLVEALAAIGITRIDNLEVLKKAPSIPFNYAGIAKKNLRPYQIAGVEFLLARRTAVLADLMGLGKTAQALTAARAVGGKLLIICPNSVKGVWSNPHDGGEIKKWFQSKRKVEIFFPVGTRSKCIRCGLPESKHDNGICVNGLASFVPESIPSDTDVVIIHFELVAAWESAILTWEPRVVVIDEAHVVYGRESKRSGAIQAIGNYDTVRHVWALTGTPMTNHPRDIFGLVETISPGRFGGEWFLPFGKRYCAGHQEDILIRGGETKTIWKFDGISRPDELARRLGMFTLRRTLQEVGLQLPAKTRQVVWLDVKGGASSRGDVPTDKRAIQLALQRAANRKLPLALERVAGLLEEGKVVVAFCYRREVAEACMRVATGPAWLIHGGIPASRRVAAIEAAKEAARVGSGGVAGGGGGILLAVTIDTCGTGINLSFCDVACFVETTYEPHKILQAEARVSRFGATRPSLMLYLMGRGTIDERVVDVVVSKLDEFAKVFGQEGESGGSGLGNDLTGATEEDIIREIMAGIE